MTTLRIGEYPTPWCTVWAVVTTDDGIVRASGLRSREETISRVGPEFVGLPHEDGNWPEVEDAVQAWVRGDATAITRVPAQQRGSEFFQQLWTAMRSIEPERPVTYAELAAMAGRPAAVRAAGQACARNNLAPFVPCHRVIKTGGRLGNYGFGAELKAALLTHEGAV